MARTRIVPRTDERVVRGFHGTSLARAEAIIEGGTFDPSTANHEWLGHGIYFWEGSEHRAHQWAAKLHGPDAAVLAVDVQIGRCVDLCDSSWAPALRAAHARLVTACGSTRSPIPTNVRGRNELDCAVVNMLCELYEVDTVRGFFTEGDAIYPGATFKELDHIQVCVRNPDAIGSTVDIVHPIQASSNGGMS